MDGGRAHWITLPLIDVGLLFWVVPSKILFGMGQNSII